VDVHVVERKFLQMVGDGLKYGVAAAGRYFQHNGRSILGLFGLLLAGWGADIKMIHPLAGSIMITTGISLKAWLSDSSSKSPKAEAP
jgi:hypothetical protein